MKQERLTAQEFRARFGGGGPGNQNIMKKPQIRLGRDTGENKTELAYRRILESEFPPHSGYEIKYEAISFRLPSGLYTPDYTVWRLGTVLTPVLTLAVEVKGGWIHRDSSKSKFKEARHAWPHIRFRFAQKFKEGWSTAE